MLDTIVLMLPRSDFRIRYPERFSPNAEAMFKMHPGRGPQKAIYNPTTAEKRTGYKPRLTLVRSPATGAVVLKVEFSAPKILFGNNFQELTPDDLPVFVRKLKAAMADMGIITTIGDLQHAHVSAIHYSKNILLDRATPCSLLIRELQKIDLNAKLDVANATFRNGGLAVRYHASSYEIAFYDKVKDLEQVRAYGDKRGMETEYDGQRNLFHQRPQKPEVLRFEVRLQLAKLKTLFKHLGIKRSLTLDGLFNATTARAVLMHYWQEVTEGLYALELDTGSSETLLHSIRHAFPRRRISGQMQLMAFARVVQEHGLRGGRLLLSLKPHQFYRLKNDLKAAAAHASNPRHTVLAAIKSELKEFIPLTADELGLIIPSFPDPQQEAKKNS